MSTVPSRRRSSSPRARRGAPSQASRPGLADLVVVLTRPKVLGKATEENALPRLLLASGKSFPPAFAVTGRKRLYAIWKGIAAGKATLQLESKTLRLPQPEIVLRPGHAESGEPTLATLPQLGVRLDLPDGLRRAPSPYRAWRC